MMFVTSDCMTEKWFIENLYTKKERVNDICRRCKN